MNIILFGFKKSGKTYYGMKLAAKLHMHFVDSDLLLEEHYRKTYLEELSYREIVKKHGFPFFREMEKHVVSSLMQSKNSVISLGGGVILDPGNRQRLEKTGVLVYIKTPKEVLEKRMLSGEPPPYIDPEHPKKSFETMYEERLPVYEAVKAHTLDTSNLTEEEILDALGKIVMDGSGD